MTSARICAQTPEDYSGGEVTIPHLLGFKVRKTKISQLQQLYLD